MGPPGGNRATLFPARHHHTNVTTKFCSYQHQQCNTITTKPPEEEIAKKAIYSHTYNNNNHINDQQDTLSPTIYTGHNSPLVLKQEEDHARTISGRFTNIMVDTWGCRANNTSTKAHSSSTGCKPLYDATTEDHPLVHITKGPKQS